MAPISSLRRCVREVWRRETTLTPGGVAPPLRLARHCQNSCTGHTVYVTIPVMLESIINFYRLRRLCMALIDLYRDQLTLRFHYFVCVCAFVPVNTKIHYLSEMMCVLLCTKNHLLCEHDEGKVAPGYKVF